MGRIEVRSQNSEVRRGREEGGGAREKIKEIAGGFLLKSYVDNG